MGREASESWEEPLRAGRGLGELSRGGPQRIGRALEKRLGGASEPQFKFKIKQAASN